MTAEEESLASQNVRVFNECSKTGNDLCKTVIEPLLKQIKPDLLWIDPALAYLGSDMNSQKDVGTFLRNYLAPLMKTYECAVVIVHHTNKISRDPEKQSIDVSYLGAGSAEWSNWCRAMLALRKTDVDNLYELIAAKRGTRLKWKEVDNQSLTFKKHIGHCKRPDTICWMEVAFRDVEELRANSGKNAEDVLKHVPETAFVGKDELITKCKNNAIGKHLAQKLIAELIQAARLFECHAPRKGVKPKVLLSRQKDNLQPDVTLDAFTRDSNGHYFAPVPKEQPKKEL